ncbi:MAG: DUF2330 domain-containing protein [Pirellulales bacterium]|nr:DUF2330 domain-containing protein [Pirellulales bacterium]
MCRLVLAVLAFVIVVPGFAAADPCGMVPPIQITGTDAISRVGLQQTYVFYKDGVESIVIRPAFTGRVEEFGMLIPFPTPPALRKVGDDIFPHIAAAIDPPEVVLNMRARFRGQGRRTGMAGRESAQLGEKSDVRVLNQEAVGMYEVAVLEAGSADALKTWMTDHGYRFPEGMEATCNDYVDLRWCFVAVKTKVADRSGVDPQPGMRGVTAGLPAGASFQGAVQGMGFRFQTDELVVPMRLSAFNAGDLRNVVYLLTDSPRRVRAIPEEYVVRQVKGSDLFANVTQLLPLRIVGGTRKDLSDSYVERLKTQRDPAEKNGLAAELFAGDLLAARTEDLSHDHEEEEKMLLRIGESLSLRGAEIDAANYAALESGRQHVKDAALKDIEVMTLTVVDGDFPREVLGAQNLTFVEYTMPARRNTSAAYDCKLNGPQSPHESTHGRGGLLGATQQPSPNGGYHIGGLVLTLAILGMIMLRSNRQRRDGSKK